MTTLAIDGTAHALEVVGQLGARPQRPAGRSTPAEQLAHLAADSWEQAARAIRATAAWKSLPRADRVASAPTLASITERAAKTAERMRASARTLRTEIEITARRLAEDYEGPPQGYETRRLRRRMVLDRLLALDDADRAEMMMAAITAGDVDVLEAIVTAGPLDRSALGAEGDALGRAEARLMELRDPARAEAVTSGREAVADLERRVAAVERVASRGRRLAEDAVAEEAEDPRRVARARLAAEAGGDAA